MRSCMDCRHYHMEGSEPVDPEVVSVGMECDFDISDEAYTDELFERFEEQTEQDDLDEFMGERCKYYERKEIPVV
jgi:hypothetical protein